MKHYFLILGLMLPRLVFADTPLISFADFINQVVKNSPEFRANLDEEKEFHQDIRIARSGYLPEINFEAIDTTGFPASTSALDVSGVMGSPFRKGAAGGFTLKQDLWDFGRTSANIEIAKNKLAANELLKEMTLENIKVVAAMTYFDCARVSADVEIWQESKNETDHIYREVEKYVHTGQRTIVDEKLSLLEAESANRNYESSQIRLTSLKDKIKVLTGNSEQILQCLDFEALKKFVTPASLAVADSPQVLFAQANIKIAESEKDREKSRYLPKLEGFASVGLLEDRRLVDAKEDYSLGIGLVFPIFQGFQVDASVEKASARIAEKQELASSEEQKFQIELQSLNEAIQVSQSELSHLASELRHAEEALTLAKTRYFHFQGSLIDLRESERALVQVQLNMSHYLASFHFAQSQKAILSRTF